MGGTWYAFCEADYQAIQEALENNAFMSGVRPALYALRVGAHVVSPSPTDIAPAFPTVQVDRDFIEFLEKDNAASQVRIRSIRAELTDLNTKLDGPDTVLTCAWCSAI